MITKNGVHCTLVGWTGIFQAKRHHRVIVYPNGIRNDAYFSSSRYILIWLYPEKSSHKGHSLDTVCVINYDISDGQQKFVLMTGCIKITKVNADSDLPVLLEYGY